MKENTGESLPDQKPVIQIYSENDDQLTLDHIHNNL